MKLIILAGGSGTRLWPVSRKSCPKQVNPIIGNKTLLEKTFSRLKKGFSPKDIYIATNRDYVSAIKKQLLDLPSKNYIIEPVRRDTAPAIGLALIKILKHDPDAVIININSDHYIKNEALYIKTIKLAKQVIKDNPDAGVLIGVNPTYPETGYGYIRMGKEHGHQTDIKVFKIAEFREKPNSKIAQEYIDSGQYLWNIGCFAWRAKNLLDLYKKHLPQTHRHLMKIYRSIDTPDEKQVTEKEFSKIEAISMDYGIVEKVKNLFVISADFGWADVGHWRTVKDILSENTYDNIKKGKVVDLDSHGNLVYSYSKKLIALAGVENMVIIETKDAILICSKDRAQDVKKLVDKLHLAGMKKYL